MFCVVCMRPINRNGKFIFFCFPVNLTFSEKFRNGILWKRLLGFLGDSMGAKKSFSLLLFMGFFYFLLHVFLWFILFYVQQFFLVWGRKKNINENTLIFLDYVV